MQFIYNIFVLQVHLKRIRRTRVRTHQHKAQVIRKKKVVIKKTFHFILKLHSILHRSLKYFKIHIGSSSPRPEKLKVLKWAHCVCVSGVALLTQPCRLTSDSAPRCGLYGPS